MERPGFIVSAKETGNGSIIVTCKYEFFIHGNLPEVIKAIRVVIADRERGYTEGEIEEGAERISVEDAYQLHSSQIHGHSIIILDETDL